MSYVTLQQLFSTLGGRELSQVASVEHRPAVPPELLIARAAGASVTAWSAEQVADADSALERINLQIAWAAEQINGYLRVRYALPLVSTPLPVHYAAVALVRRKLHKDLHDADNEIQRAYEQALKYLADLAAGRQLLDAPTPPPQAGIASAAFASAPALWAASL
jgi:phage gp36-like protein